MKGVTFETKRFIRACIIIFSLLIVLEILGIDITNLPYPYNKVYVMVNIAACIGSIYTEWYLKRKKAQ